ncbi:MAG TPA: hypothetical protein PLS12_07840, partial [Bacteroidales bacterium]|nr:hypothetical protein [Bacteroidales bacterium]
IGTRNGLNKLDIKPKKFTIITDNTNSADAFTNITTLYANNTHVFIGTKFNGLFIYSISNKQSNNFHHNLKTILILTLPLFIPFQTMNYL